MTGYVTDGVHEDFTAVLGRAIEYRVGLPARGMRLPRYPVTGYVLGSPVDRGDGWHLVAIVVDGSLPRSRLRVWWHQDTRVVTIDRGDGIGADYLP